MENNKENNVVEALANVDLNAEKGEGGCIFCGKENPTKKCSKSHARCKGKLFCDKKCEMSSHKQEKEEQQVSIKEEDEENKEDKDALQREMDEAAKADKAKKKKAKKMAKKDGKNKSNGEFWWNNSVYASW